MRLHVNTDKELVNLIREGLRNNDGYCPCIMNSKGKEEYKCICQDMRENFYLTFQKNYDIINYQGRRIYK